MIESMTGKKVVRIKLFYLVGDRGFVMSESDKKQNIYLNKILGGFNAINIIFPGVIDIPNGHK